MNTGRITCLLASFAAAFAAEAAVRIVEPAEDATVPVLWPEIKSFLDMPRETRKTYRDSPNTSEKSALKARKGTAKPVCLKWKGDAKRYGVKVVRLPDGKEFFSADVDSNSVCVTGRLEIARRWKWTVTDGKDAATGTFRTEDRAPRILDWPGVKNVRDIGGRIGLDGRRVKQGLVFRSGGLNNNAEYPYYTYEEILDLHKQGKLATAGVGISRGKGAEYEQTLRKGKKLDKGFLRLIKAPPEKPGEPKLDEAGRRFILDTYGIRSDLDFRGDWECFGMTGSPLGDDVAWYHYMWIGGYGNVVKPDGRASAARAFSLFLEPKNYPIDFHCIGGTDRTGAFAYLLNGLLGVEEEELIRDYEMSFIGSAGVDKRHYGWLMNLVDAVRSLPGETIAEKLKGYFVSLGFTPEQVESVREFLLEPAEGEKR